MSNLSPTDITVEEINIESPNGKRQDITDLVSELNIYEELNSPLLTADMIIVDAAALYANFPIVGQEKVSGKIKRGDEVRSFEFYVTTVEDMKNINNFTNQYTINLVDRAYLQNIVTLISESYSGSISNMITSIFEDHLGAEIDAEQTDGNFKIVVPNWNPYRVVGWMMSRAKNSNNVPCVCYNTLYNGLKLKSLQTLYEQDPVTKFFYQQQRTDQRTIQRGEAANRKELESTAIIMYPTKVAPTVETIAKGGYSSRTLLVDTRTKSFTKFDFNYKEQFDQGTHLSKKSVISDKYTIKDKDVFSQATSIQRNFFSSSESFDSSHTDYNGGALDTTPFRMSYFALLENYKYRVGVRGRLDIEVGSVIDIGLIKNLLQTKQNTEEVNDDLRSGKHIVTRLRHQFTNNSSYHLIMDVARDTMEKDL